MNMNDSCLGITCKRSSAPIRMSITDASNPRTAGDTNNVLYLSSTVKSNPVAAGQGLNTCTLHGCNILLYRESRFQSVRNSDLDKHSTTGPIARWNRNTWFPCSVW